MRLAAECKRDNHDLCYQKPWCECTCHSRVPLPAGPEPRERNPRILAIDPGDVHVGLAQFVCEACYWAGELGPGESLIHLRRWLEAGALDLVVCEEFRLYPDVALSMSGKEMLTSELIGAIKYLCAWYGVRLVMQPASIQEPTLGVLRSRRMNSTAKKHHAGPHALSAELHGWYWILHGSKKEKPS